MRSPVGALISLLLIPCPVVQAQTSAPDPTPVEREALLTTHATGTFEVTLTPLSISDSTEGTPLGRYSLEKVWHGDLEGTSRGEMLTGGTDVKGSAGYVAMERVSATLGGRRGTFILQHSGTMMRGAPSLLITVVPDSGTDQLAGITGTLMIIIAAGKHSYDFEYLLAP